MKLRMLKPGDCKAFRAVRLEALKQDGKFFAASYDEEVEFSDEHWRRRCGGDPEHGVVGLFDENELVGVSGVSRWQEDDKGMTALFGSSYVKPAYRGKGLAGLLYLERVQWARRDTRYAQSMVFHREGNQASRVVNQRCGAQYCWTRPMRWADGQTAEALWYRIALK
jgi:RimJ/RimL family protein N-acetyltransferase